MWLDGSHRMTPALSAVVEDLLGVEDCSQSSTAHDTSDSVVEFVAVHGMAKTRPGRDHGRGPRNGTASHTTLPSAGAGLETELAAPRSTDRVLNDLRSSLPTRGLVNLTEAKAVVRRLEELLSHATRGNGQAYCQESKFAVIALSFAQAELIRLLVHQSPKLRAQCISPSGIL